MHTMRRRVAPLSILLLWAVWFALPPAGAQVAGKGTPRGTDVRLVEGFESEAWRIGWTVVDGDGGGTTWGRLGVDQHYRPRGGSWSLGSRFNEDGPPSDDWLITPPMRADSANRTFTIYYRSQDPDWPENVEFLSLHTAVPLAVGILASRRGDFTLIRHQENIPTEWQQFQHVVEPEDGGVWYFAVRCVSPNRFMLLVDDASGFWTQSLSNWVLEPAYERMDFGLLRQEERRTRPFRLWNMHEDSLLEVTISHRPRAPFVMSSTWSEGGTLDVTPEDSLGAVAGVFPVMVDGADTIRYQGSFSDSLVLDLFHHAGELARLVIPFTAAIWEADSLEDLLLHETFESDTLAAGWDSVVGEGASDPLGWQFGSHASSANFTVPLGSRFAYINSDGRGRFTPAGLPLTQDAWLITPWLDVSRTAEGDPARGLLLGWDQVYDSRAGGCLELWADSAGTGWRLAGQATSSTVWTSRDLDLSRLAGADSLRLAFRFRGAWSYGAAVDNVVLLPVSELLPGLAAPEPPPPLPTAQVAIAPNPFNPVTQVRYEAREAGRLEIRVHNLLGQQVMSRGPYLLRPGDNTFALDFGQLASGVYLVRLVSTDAGGRMEQHLRRVTFLK